MNQYFLFHYFPVIKSYKKNEPAEYVLFSSEFVKMMYDYSSYYVEFKN